MKHRHMLICLLLNPLYAQAATFSLEGQLIAARAMLDPDKKVHSNPTVGPSLQALRDIDEAVTAAGVGLRASYHVTPAARIGGDLVWVNYDQGNSKPQYQDMSAALNASYDVYRMNIFTFYGLGGFSYHSLEAEDRTLGAETTSMDNAELVNLDLGIGGRMDLSSNVFVDTSYRYSDSIQTDNVAVDTSSPTGLVRTTLKDMALKANQFVASVGYQF